MSAVTMTLRATLILLLSGLMVQGGACADGVGLVRRRTLREKSAAA